MNVAQDRDAAGVVLAEVPHQAASAARDPQPHQGGVIIMLPKPTKDLGDIVPGSRLDDLLVLLAHVGLEAAQVSLDLGIRGQRVELPLEHLPHGDDALVGTVLLRETGCRDGLALIDVHYVHGAVADVRQHVRAPELAQPVGDCREPLIEHEHIHDIDVIIAVLVGEVDVGVFGQVCLELLPLLVSPGQGKAGGDDDLRRGQAPMPELLADGRQRQDVIIVIHDLVLAEFLVAGADGIALVLVGQHVVHGEAHLLVAGRDAGRENEGRGLDVAIAVVDGDDEGGIVAGLVPEGWVGRLLLDAGVGIDDVDGLGFIILIHKFSFSTSMGVCLI